MGRVSSLKKKNMLKEITIRFCGEQGSGVQFTGQLMSDYLTRAGYHVFAVNDFESRIRGGYSFVQLCAGTSEVYSIKKEPEVSIPFSRSVVENDIKTLSPNTVLILPNDSVTESINAFKKHVIDLDKLLDKSSLPFRNTFFVSFLAALLGTELELLKDAIQFNIKRKGTEIIENNLRVAETGYNYARKKDIEDFLLDKPENPKDKKRALSGSYAISAGAVASNCRFYAAYPMSPSTSVIERLSGWSKDYGILTEQAEDEIAAINLSLGASYAGVRAMVGTSGGGLALMSETVSLAALTEVPIVILNAQRPGPATGLPTRTEQGDLFFTLFMGHGEFTKILLAPGTHEKAFELTQKAFYLADKYQIPVFILTDQYLMDSIKSCEKWSDVREFKERFIDDSDDYQGSYQRYSFTKDGISPRKIPGMTEEAVVADSHTHDESGHICEDSEIRKKNVEKLLMKKEKILKDISPPYISTDIQKDTLLIGWGSTFGVISDAVQILTEEGFSVCHIHYHEIYPLNLDYLNPTKPYKKVISIENNATGQFAKLMQMEGLTVDEKILKYNGRPFYLDELLSEIKRMLRS